MKKGFLSDYFSGVAFKRLSAVETLPHISNQHEFNGVGDLKSLLGADRNIFNATFIYLSDDDAELLTCKDSLTWYDARENHPTRSEFRLYFPSNPVMDNANEGDLLVIGKLTNGDLLLIVAESGTTIENQIRWLFAITSDGHPGYSVKHELESLRFTLEYTSRAILESIGIVVDETDEDYLEILLAEFNGKFPPTLQFSSFARSTAADVDALSDPDGSLMAWMDREEILFRTLEKHLIGDRLRQGFAQDSQIDVDGFIGFSLSVQNRRKELL